MALEGLVVWGLQRHIPVFVKGLWRLGCIKVADIYDSFSQGPWRLGSVVFPEIYTVFYDCLRLLGSIRVAEICTSVLQGLWRLGSIRVPEIYEDFENCLWKPGCIVLQSYIPALHNFLCNFDSFNLQRYIPFWEIRPVKFCLYCICRGIYQFVTRLVKAWLY
jgi:hypothetical protein